MIQNKSVLGIITARGGSKGVPRKNIRRFGGKPLISWSIEAALSSTVIDRVVVSSEDAEILDVAREYGADIPLVRPVELALDHTPGIDPVIHAIETVPGYDFVVLLQPTSPLRAPEDIDACVVTCVTRGANTCVAVCEAQKSPYLFYQVSSSLELKPLMNDDLIAARRQDVPRWYTLNGAVYVAQTQYLLQSRAFIGKGTLAHVMPIERSVDIDTELDWAYGETLLSNRK